MPNSKVLETSTLNPALNPKPEPESRLPTLLRRHVSPASHLATMALGFQHVHCTAGFFYLGFKGASQTAGASLGALFPEIVVGLYYFSCQGEGCIM